MVILEIRVSVALREALVQMALMDNWVQREKRVKRDLQALQAQLAPRGRRVQAV
jgi:hypothetical protein